MKNGIKIILCVSACLSFACEGSYLIDSDLITEKEPSGKVSNKNIVHESFGIDIVSKQYNAWGKGYFSVDTNQSESFLFYLCELDCNEKVFKSAVDESSKTFACLIKDSTRFKTKNRLMLFQFTENATPVKVLDTVKEVYKTFRFEGNKFIYTLEDRTEKSIDLS